MLEKTLGELEAAKLKWLTGGAAVADGNDFAGNMDPTETQLRLLAQAAVFKHSCLRPPTPQNLTQMPLLPAPDLPLLPETLRPAFRYLMQPNDRVIWEAVVGLMASRGFMAHPFDWLPPQDVEGYPASYIPLAKWQAGVAQPSSETVSADLNEETWDEMYPADRRTAFIALRLSDPMAARTLMEAKGSALPADQRLHLVKAMAHGLSDADADYLSTLVEGDRSPKVKSVAKGFLARLGAVEDGADADELADFMKISTKGLLKKRKIVGWRSKLNDAQKKRINELFATVSLSGFASALGMTETELAEAYVAEPYVKVEPFFHMAVRSAATDVLLIYWAQLKKADLTQLNLLQDMKDRLSPAHVMEEVTVLIGSKALGDLRDVLSITGPDVGQPMSGVLLNSHFYKSKINEFKVASAKREAGQRDYKSAHTIDRFEDFVSILSFLITDEAAATVLHDLEKIGVHAADPLLRPLQFNIALQGTTS